MAIEVKKKDGETNESLMRRFTKKVQSSGMIIRAKQSKFKESPKNRTQQKRDALRKKEIKKQYDYLRKSGKLEDSTTGGSPANVKKFIRVKKK